MSVTYASRDIGQQLTGTSDELEQLESHLCDGSLGVLSLFRCSLGNNVDWSICSERRLLQALCS